MNEIGTKINLQSGIFCCGFSAFSDFSGQGIQVGEEHFREEDSVFGVSLREGCLPLCLMRRVYSDAAYFLCPIGQTLRDNACVEQRFDFLLEAAVYGPKLYASCFHGTAGHDARGLDVAVQHVELRFMKILRNGLGRVRGSVHALRLRKNPCEFIVINISLVFRRFINFGTYSVRTMAAYEKANPTFPLSSLVVSQIKRHIMFQTVWA